jgi:hypothetical protein
MYILHLDEKRRREQRENRARRARAEKSSEIYKCEIAREKQKRANENEVS